MSDLAATGCGCGGSTFSGGKCSCNILIWLLVLSCVCGGEEGNSLFGGNLFGDGCGCGRNNWIWIIVLIFLLG